MSNRTSNPYESMSHEERMGMFNSKVWGELKREEKVQLLQAVGDWYAKEHGITDPPVVVASYGNYYGQYATSLLRKKTVYINLNYCVNPYQALCTLAHEENHCLQEQCIETGNGLGKYSPEEIALMKAEFKAYRGNGDEYYMQSVENDSNVAGTSFVLSERDRFIEDPAYIAFLASNRIAIDDMAEIYTDKRLKSDDSESKQIEDAYEANEISEEERLDAIKCITDGQNSIKQNLVKTYYTVENEYVNSANEYYQLKADERAYEDRFLSTDEKIDKYLSSADEALKNEKNFSRIYSASTYISNSVKYKAQYDLRITQIEAQVIAGRLYDIRNELIEKEAEVRLNPELVEKYGSIEQLEEQQRACLDKAIQIENQGTEISEKTNLDLEYSDQRPNDEAIEKGRETEKEEIQKNPEMINDYLGKAAALHQSFDHYMHDYQDDSHMSKKEIEKRHKEMVELQHSNAECIERLMASKSVLEAEKQTKMDEYGRYCAENNLAIWQAHQNSYLNSLAQDMNSLDQQISTTDYRIAELTTDNELMQRETGVEVVLPGMKQDVELQSALYSNVDPHEDVEENINEENERDSLREKKDIYEALKEEAYEENVDEIKSEIEQGVLEESEKELTEETKEELKEDIEEDLTEETKEELKEDIEEDLTVENEEELKEETEEELKEETEAVQEEKTSEEIAADISEIEQETPSVEENIEPINEQEELAIEETEIEPQIEAVEMEEPAIGAELEEPVIEAEFEKPVIDESIDSEIEIDDSELDVNFDDIEISETELEMAAGEMEIVEPDFEFSFDEIDLEEPAIDTEFSENILESSALEEPVLEGPLIEEPLMEEPLIEESIPDISFEEEPIELDVPDVEFDMGNGIEDIQISEDIGGIDMGGGIDLGNGFDMGIDPET